MLHAKLFFYSILFCLSLPATSFAQASNNIELQQLYDNDQAARSTASINWIEVSKDDRAREKRVYELIGEGKVKTGRDFYNAAMIFQHGTDTTASGMAVKMMRRALSLDSTVNRWLLAAAIDRDLMRKGKPQIYGTQYSRNGQDSKFKRYKIDTTQVTDAERKYYHVETLAEQKIKEHNMNALQLADFYQQSASIDTTLALIKLEALKGTNSEYNVSEEAINSFGYSLMSENKTTEALEVFKLNTVIYPNGFNTFDSYGECLLKLNLKEEAIQAYKRSIELNPKNENAKVILNSLH